ncbi:MAG: carboxypeptidase-like regulatory domain-containing protein [Nannocystaceae bacterium]|nr:carboxypeptidase-like regulatory domain-containing protein [Nannocystaceae bacterium]
MRALALVAIVLSSGCVCTAVRLLSHDESEPVPLWPSLTVRVRDGSGAAVPRARVMLHADRLGRGPTLAQVSDRDGIATIEAVSQQEQADLGPWRWSLCVDAPGHGTATTAVHEGGTLELVLQPPHRPCTVAAHDAEVHASP